MDFAAGQVERAVEHGLGRRAVVVPQGNAHGANVDDFHHVEARLPEEIAGAAVDPHSAAELIDQAQFFVGV